MKYALLFVASAFLVSSAQAQSLAEKAAWKKAETSIAEYSEGVAKSCGTKVAFELDKKSFTKEDIPNVSNFMWAATEAVSYVCVNVEGAKDEFKSKLKTVKMSKGKANAFKLNGTTVAYTTDLSGGSATPRDAMTEWLKTAF